MTTSINAATATNTTANNVDKITPWCDGGEDRIPCGRYHWIIDTFRCDIRSLFNPKRGSEAARMRGLFGDLRGEILSAAKRRDKKSLDKLKLRLMDLISQAFEDWESDMECELRDLTSISEVALAHDVLFNRRTAITPEHPIWSVVKENATDRLEGVCRELRATFEHGTDFDVVEGDPLVIISW